MRKVAFLFVTATALTAQVRQIDPTKLPQVAAVQRAYRDLLPIDEFARNFASSWPYSVSQKEVTKRFTKDLKTLQGAQAKQPSNMELQILTGLVGHLAYNLSIESAYTPALQLLTQAEATAKSDFRPAWFLAMHQCESNNSVEGMQRLLAVEANNPQLPAAFWRDYALCAQVTSMPVHAIRAYDNAAALGPLDSGDIELQELAQKRITPASPTAKYPNLSAWTAEQTGTTVRFTSGLCGESFTVPETASTDSRHHRR